MTVRFKCQSEYQKSYGVPRSRSVSPQRCTPLAGIRSDHMGVSREPSLHRRRKLGLAKSCTSLLYPSDQHHLNPEPSSHAHRTGPSAASRSHSVQRKEPSLVPGPPTPPEFRSEPDSPLESEPPIGPRPTEEPARQEKSRHAAGTGPSAEPGAAGKSTKPRPSRPGSQSRPSHPVSSAANEVDVALLKKAGLRSGGQRSGGQRSEYHRQFSWKKPVAAASPILTAEQAVYSSSRSVPPLKKHPVTMETEYRRSFQGLAPPSGPRLRKHLEHQRVPLFHTHMKNKKRRESRHKPRPDYDVTNHLDDDATPPPQVHRGHRMLTEYQSSFRSHLRRVTEDGGGAATDGDAPQVRTHDEGWGHTLRDGVKELRQQAMSYRRRAWGTNFSRDHLNQLRSEHNALWEPTDTSVTDPPTPRINLDLSPDPDSRSVSCVEALDLASRSSQRSSVAVSGETNDTNKNTQIKAQRRPGRPAETRPAWGDDEDDDDGDEDEDEDNDEDEGGRNTDEEEEGRLPTPRLRMRPVQRTHHDLTTPATGGAILVGKLRSSDTSSPVKQRSVSAFSTAAWADATVNSPSKRTEAWSENNPHPSGPASPEHKAASKPIRMKQTPAPPAALPPPLHGFHGMLRHPDFQHNGSQITSVESQQKQDSPSLLFTSLTLSVKGDLGLRFRDPLCPGGRCCDEDERLSVMSWRSAASCSAASAVLERAQKRHEDFWGKR